MGRAADAGETVDRFAVTPGRADRAEILAALPRLATLGVTKLLLRERSASREERRKLAEALLPKCRRAAIALWISDDVELAASLPAAGVQLSEAAPSPRVVRARLPASIALGVSLHEPISRSADELAVCDHAFLGPVFPTPSKRDARPLGIAGFLRLAATVSLPVYAIGGIGAAELRQLEQAGVRRVAAIRLFFGVPVDRAARGAS